MRKLYQNDVLDLLYGATFLGSGGGGTLKSGIELINRLAEEKSIELNLLDVSEINSDDYAAMVAGLGAPTAMEEKKFGNEAIYAFEGLQKVMAKEDVKINYLYSGELGGFNTAVPIYASLKTGTPLLDVDGNRRAVPELNTSLTTVHGFPTYPLSLANANGDVIIGYTKNPLDDKAAELIARQMCMAYGMSIGFSTWHVNKQEMNEYLVPGALTLAENIGKAIAIAKVNKCDPIIELKKNLTIRELFSGTVIGVETTAMDGFDFGTTSIRVIDKTYTIDFKNENLLAKDENGDVMIAVPESICLLDMDTYIPLTNADIKEGMNVSVYAVPAHESWWKVKKGFDCWKSILLKVGYDGGPVKF